MTTITKLLRAHAGALGVSVLFIAAQAQAQTWAGGRETPALTELVSVDATGEPNWPFGAEDVADDGVTVFSAEERGVDLRSLYAGTDDARFWLRSYVVATSEPDPTLRVYAFIDADDDTTTGGSAAAENVAPELTQDPTSGGYDYVLGFSGAGDLLGIWDYSAQTDSFEPNAPAEAQAQAESGVDLDPLRYFEDRRGYAQVSLERGVIALSAGCGIEIFVRAVSERGSDLEASPRVSCVPPDSDNDGVPNVVDTVVECTVDADCPASGACIDGACRYAPACVDDTDCAADEACTDGRCVATGGQDCSSSADCDGLVCVSGTCSACGGNVSCAAGRACAADGRCVAGSPGGDGTAGGDDAAGLVDADEKVQGGAFTCGLARGASSLSWLLAAGVLALMARRKRTR